MLAPVSTFEAALEDHQDGLGSARGEPLKSEVRYPGAAAYSVLCLLEKVYSQANALSVQDTIMS